MNAPRTEQETVRFETYEACYKDWSKLFDQNVALRAENRRLREALVGCADAIQRWRETGKPQLGAFTEAHDAARAALAGKGDK